MDALGVSEGKNTEKIKIELPFEQREFDSGLRKCGTEKEFVGAVQHYTISSYQDLNTVLGKNWHFLGLNSEGDFRYVLLNTVDYYFYHSKPKKVYVPGPDGGSVQRYLRRGDVLAFTFERGNGTPDQFGTDEDIFPNN